MTATTRSGDFRFTFPAGGGYITIPGGRASGNTVTGTTTVPGICGFGGGVAGHYLYRFNKPFTVNGDVLTFHTTQLIVKGATRSSTPGERHATSPTERPLGLRPDPQPRRDRLDARARCDRRDRWQPRQPARGLHRALPLAPRAEHVQ